MEEDSEVDGDVIGAGVPREVTGCVIERRGLGVVVREENDGRPRTRAARNGEDCCRKVSSTCLSSQLELAIDDDIRDLADHGLCCQNKGV